MLWKPPTAWFSVNASFVPDGDGRRLRNWYVNFEHPTRRTEAGFDTLDLTRWEWKVEGEYAVEAARGEVLTMPAELSGVFAQAQRWSSWRWEPAWPTPCLPPGATTAEKVTPEAG
ncbi:hypothetical protein [Streptomyces niveus]